LKIDAVTKRWMRNASDERAVRNGCTFDEERGNHVCDFITQNLRLYEGEQAGQLFPMIPWEHECLMRIYGWVRFSPDCGRSVRRFTKAGVWLPKKQGKSPWASANGIYLLVADGEQGQKVFSAAKDGKQAGIMHMHARKMVEQSDALASECKINKSSGRIVHLPTNSFYDVLAGDNITGQEGINGSVIIDETHVVDARLASVIEYALRQAGRGGGDSRRRFFLCHLGGAAEGNRRAVRRSRGVEGSQPVLGLHDPGRGVPAVIRAGQAFDRRLRGLQKVPTEYLAGGRQSVAQTGRLGEVPHRVTAGRLSRPAMLDGAGPLEDPRYVGPGVGVQGSR
jgi:hypothetical protein